MKEVNSFSSESDFQKAFKDVEIAMNSDTDFVSTAATAYFGAAEFLRRTGVEPILPDCWWWALKFCEADNQLEIKEKLEKMQIKDFTNPEVVKLLLPLNVAEGKILRYAKVTDIKLILEAGFPEWLTDCSLVQTTVTALRKIKADGLPLWLIHNEKFSKWCAKTHYEHLLVPRFLVRDSYVRCTNVKAKQPFTDNFTKVRFAMGDTVTDFSIDDVCAGLAQLDDIVRLVETNLMDYGEWFPAFGIYKDVFIMILDYKTPIELIRGEL